MISHPVATKLSATDCAKPSAFVFNSISQFSFCGSDRVQLDRLSVVVVVLDAEGQSGGLVYITVVLTFADLDNFVSQGLPIIRSQKFAT